MERGQFDVKYNLNILHVLVHHVFGVVAHNYMKDGKLDKRLNDYLIAGKCDQDSTLPSSRHHQFLLHHGMH